MRRVHLGIAATAALLLAGGAASAQSQVYKPKPLNLQKEQRGSVGMANLARARMRSGDCQGALDAFDAALRASTDPTIFRDRGLCHEMLGHPYPAIGDYRIYLTNEPEAPDAEGISQRLRRLEDEASEHEAQATPTHDKYSGVALDNVSVGAFGVNAAPARATSSEKLEAATGDEEELRLPLRRGTGLSIAPVFELRGWFLTSPSTPVADHASLGDSLSLAECVGARLGYALGAPGGLVLEAGYERFNSANVDLSTVVGLTSQLAYEFRVSLDPRADNQFIIAPGVGYEHLVSAPSNPQFATQTYDALVPRLRLGYRRLLTPDAGFDLALNVGVATFINQPADQSLPVIFMAGATASFVWGLR